MSRMMNGLRGLLAATVALSMTSACAAEPAAAAKSPPPPATAQPAAATPAPCAALKGAKPAGFERLDVITATGCASFYVEIADDDAEREQGLMFRKSLAPDRGMLFDFHSPREVAFWMHNTLIPLDIIYVQADGTVLSIARNAMPLSDAPIPSGGPILGVLELPGGRAAEIGLLPGDQIKHRMFPGG